MERFLPTRITRDRSLSTHENTRNTRTKKTHNTLLLLAAAATTASPARNAVVVALKSPDFFVPIQGIFKVNSRDTDYEHSVRETAKLDTDYEVVDVTLRALFSQQVNLQRASKI